MTTMLSLNVLNVLIIQIKMAFYYLHLLLSMVHVVHSSRDHLQLIKEFYKKDIWSFIDVLQLYQKSIFRDDQHPSLFVSW